MNKNLIDTFINLAECRLTATDWLTWFNNNKELVGEICGRTTFLRIKPKDNLSDIGNAYSGQVAAVDWLKKKNVAVVVGDTYQKAYQHEFSEFCKHEQEKDKERQKKVKVDFGYLENLYPKFFKQLQKSFDTANTIEKGKLAPEISRKEQALSLTFSAELNTFFSNISKLILEGITIDFDDIYAETFDKKQFLVLGEFWLYGDGDLLLYDLTTGNCFSYAHEYSPPKIIALSKTMTELLEKNFSKYLKSYDQ
ncbi:hypothetical protein [Pedobacter caeni]|uniref:SMI1 / KNR4 family (SUKH-1) n=1 Tax=Pedobacter caeni TaxID=288992 RepID=A0A1M5DEV5_9SPHI|nr:hypothetical protein [Pedobacter caeni]SHF65480.1 hypothetical protein SAMN04488522_103201 [Pedobacter caeni]